MTRDEIRALIREERIAMGNLFAQRVERLEDDYKDLADLPGRVLTLERDHDLCVARRRFDRVEKDVQKLKIQTATQGVNVAAQGKMWWIVIGSLLTGVVSAILALLTAKGG